MAVSTIGVAEPSSPDKQLHSWQRSIASVDREDQFVLPGQNPYPTYTAIAQVALDTTASHLLMIQADGTNYTRLVRAWITPSPDVPAAAAVINVQLWRTSTAGSSGSAVTVGAFDSADTYAGTVQTLPSSKGTEAALLWSRRVVIPGPTSVTVIPAAPFYEVGPYSKPIICGVANTSGLVFKLVASLASTQIDIVAEFITTPYL